MRIEFINAKKLNEVVGRFSLNCGEYDIIVDVIPTTLANVTGWVPVRLEGNDFSLETEDGILVYNGHQYEFSWGEEDTLVVEIF